MIETKTIKGKKVYIHEYKPYNSANNKVTFPLKGTIVLGKRKKEFCIWTIEGKASVLKDHMTEKNIIITDDIIKFINENSLT